jgi:ABC-type sugar transport system substrate-binding protein
MGIVGFSKRKVITALFVLIVAMVLSFPPAFASDKKITIGTIVPTLVNEFWVYYTNFQKKVAQDLGIELIVLDSQDSGERQVANIEDAISKKVDGIVFVPYWGTGKVGFKKCEEAGIPVIATDCTTPGVEPQEQYKQYIAFIGPNDTEAGYEEAKALIAAAKPAPDGKKHIVALQGTLGTSVAIGRFKGLQQALKENPDVVLDAEQTANFMRDDAVKVMEDFMAAHQHIGGVWSANDGMSIGAITAIKRTDKVLGKDVIVTGLNLDPPALEAIKEGTMLWSTGGHWLMGGFATVMLFDHIKGVPVPKDKCNVKLTLAPVTKETLEDFYKAYPGGQPTYDAKKYSRFHNPSAPPAYFDLKF